MAFTFVDAADVKPTWGTFRMIRHALGGTAFGLNQIDFPPDKVGSEHDETRVGPGGDLSLPHRERHAGDRRRDRRDEAGPLHPRLAGVEAAARSRVGGMSFLCVGGVSGGVYEPWAPPDE